VFKVKFKNKHTVRTLGDNMLNAKNLGLAGGILWGLCMFICTWLAVSTGYALAFMNSLMSLYPGYTVTALGSVIGLVYGFIDGFVGLWLLAWLYNKLEKK